MWTCRDIFACSQRGWKPKKANWFTKGSNAAILGEAQGNTKNPIFPIASSKSWAKLLKRVWTSEKIHNERVFWRLKGWWNIERPNENPSKMWYLAVDDSDADKINNDELVISMMSSIKNTPNLDSKAELFMPSSIYEEILGTPICCPWFLYRISWRNRFGRPSSCREITATTELTTAISCFPENHLSVHWKRMKAKEDVQTEDSETFRKSLFALLACFSNTLSSVLLSDHFIPKHCPHQLLTWWEFLSLSAERLFSTLWL